jgi:mannose-6-phosphate isomerase-like protein (cupin superfamily)
MYVVLDGEVEISNGETAVVLASRDSCRIAPGEDRQLRNANKTPAVILLAMPLPPEERG